MGKGKQDTKASAGKQSKGGKKAMGEPKSKVAGLDATAASDKGVPAPTVFADALRVGDGFILADCDPHSTPGFDGDKKHGEEALAARAGEISQFQERLYAESRGAVKRSLLLVVQGMDTSGKGGIMRHVVGQMDPQGVKYTAFKAPTAEERKHPFLWRIRNAMPSPGQVGVFDRSHYEDVLIVRVHELVPRATWSRRYAQINDFEAKAVADGTTVVKVMLHISSDEQKARLTERLEREDKHWKYNPGDVDERLRWPQYQEAYQAVLEKTSTEAAPWYVVPADRRWYARLAVQNLVLEHLETMNPQWPPAAFDVEAEKQRLAKS
ncbi:PPK2 family polyphosphate:nucleotide phosphotransferase [Phycicoccus badiiscoriae]|uniref:PPK2 family polyphosphate:nucleotide phosphotransferase n=1 Tax=Pedococcus badiiscoriae TaxID=642776 RepID=A0A852WR42_9MICO|nr:polyphosphate kinase 2 family protein [Pedococcus badiiscoriae]NYG08675.1 PPK2 family polyphosphate:nucleotide phosphotransferase [Pedococcus badiiscoriae]